MITCEVLLPGSRSWIVISVVYAANQGELRRDLWNEIVELASSQAISSKLWMVFGDFN